MNNNNERLLFLKSNFISNFGLSSSSKYFSSPGRLEILGNHTDHNKGKVVAASINLDTLALADVSNDNYICINSKEYDQKIKINLLDGLAPKVEDSKSDLLIKGIIDGFNERGIKVGGLNISTTTSIYPASGLSSSASFELLIGKIIDYYFNDERLDVVELSKIGQHAENKYWNKKSGLLDQIACGHGGVISIDFNCSSKPLINELEELGGVEFIVINAGGEREHADEQYGQIENDMVTVARYFNKNTLSEVSYDDFVMELGKLTSEINERALLRAIHFFEENNRVTELEHAINTKDLVSVYNLTNASGLSSWRFLQNLYNPESKGDQKLPFYLKVTEDYIKSIDGGACRVHGGGFGGTILVIIPNDHADEYIKLMRDVYKLSKIEKLSINTRGVACLEEEKV